MTNKYTKYKTFCIYPTIYVIMDSGMHSTHIFDTCVMPDIVHMHIFVHYVLYVFADHTKHRNSLHLTTHTCRTCTQPDLPIKFRLLVSVFINKTCVYDTFQFIRMQYMPVHSFT